MVKVNKRAVAGETASWPIQTSKAGVRWLGATFPKKAFLNRVKPGILRYLKHMMVVEC